MEPARNSKEWTEVAYKNLREMGVPESELETAYDLFCSLEIRLTAGCQLAFVVCTVGDGRYLSSVALLLLHDVDYSVSLARGAALVLLNTDDYELWCRTEVTELAGAGCSMFAYAAIIVFFKLSYLLLWLIRATPGTIYFALRSGLVAGFSLFRSLVAGKASTVEVAGCALAFTLAYFQLHFVLLARLRQLGLWILIAVAVVVSGLSIRIVLTFWAALTTTDYYLLGEIPRLWARLSAIPKINGPADQNNQYQYRPLKDREIRLLLIQRQCPFAPVECKLIHTQMSRAPAYEAISYVWGDSKPTNVVRVEGLSMPISRSVCRILENKASFRTPKYLWIDALCIKQDDSDEKESQIQMMRDIYSHARAVTVDLGDAPDAHRVPIFLVLLALIIRFKSPESRDSTILSLYSAEKNANNGKQPKKWLALLNLLRNPWFERAWVVQEFAAASAIRVLYGNRYLNFGQLTDVIIYTALGPHGGLRSSVVTLDSDNFATSLAGMLQFPVMRAFRSQFQSGQPPKLHIVLRAMQSSRASTPVDKVYAFLGLSDAAGSPDLPIVYGGQPSELRLAMLMNMAYYFIKRPESLRVLQRAGIGWPQSQTDIPSWVVDWTQTLPLDNSAVAFGIENQHAFRAATDVNASISFKKGSREIIIDGLVVDSLATVNESMYSDYVLPKNGTVSNLHLSRGWLRYLRTAEAAAKNMAPNPYFTSQPLAEAIWRTLISDVASSGVRPAPISRGIEFQDFKEGVVREYLASHGVPDDAKISCSTLLTPDVRDWIVDVESDPRPGMERAKSCGRFVRAIGSASALRSFAVTEKGYIGLVPPKAKPGDLVCLFFGAEVPFVLRKEAKARKSSATFNLVGESYIHGMMDGEMLWAGLGKESFEIW